MRDRARFYQSATAYQHEGKYKEAVIQYSNALKVDPRYAEAHYGLAMSLLHLKSPIQAYQELSRTVELQPANIQARIDLAKVMIGGGLTKEPTEQTTAILALDPHNADAYSLRARLAAQQNRSDEAMFDIKQAIAAAPKRADFRNQLALLLLSTPNRQAEAEAELQNAIAADPAQAYSHLLLASINERTGNQEAAEKDLLAAKEASPGDPATYTALARHYGLVGDTHAEEATLSTAADSLPTNDDLPGLLGSFYRQTGQIGHGLTIFETLHTKHPKSIGIGVEYATLLDIANHPVEARQIAAKLIKASGHDVLVIAMQTRFLTEDGKRDEALSLLQSAVKDNPSDSSLRLLFAQATEAKGDLATAETNYQAAVHLEPANLQASTGLASVALKKSDFLLLMRISQDTLQNHPGYAPALLWKATAETAQSQYDKAATDAEDALKLNPKNTDAYRLLADVRLLQHKQAEAHKLLEQAYGIDPAAPAVIRQLNRLDTASGHGDAAIARLKRQINQSPNDGTAYTELATLEIQAGDNAAAYSDAQKALSLKATDSQTIAILSNAATATGHSQEASTTLSAWLAAHPGNPTATNALGNLAEITDRNKAIDLYRRTLQTEPHNAMALNNLAYLMTESGQNLDEALTYAQQSQRLTPHLASATDTLAWVYYRKGSYRAAKDLLEDAAKTSPANASVQYHLGLVYESLKNNQLAEQHLATAARLGGSTDTGAKAQRELTTLRTTP